MSDGRGARILVADDVLENVRLLEAVLTSRGHDVVSASDAWETLARLGCDTVRGYYLSRPLLADALELHRTEPAGRAVAL